MKLDDLKFEMDESWKEFSEENPAYKFIPEFADTPEGTSFLRGHGRSTVYKVIDDEKLHYECTTCESPILMAMYDHPMLEDGKIDHYEEQVPFCPNCEDLSKTDGATLFMGTFNPREARKIKN